MELLMDTTPELETNRSGNTSWSRARTKSLRTLTKQITRADEQIARADEQLSKLEHEAAGYPWIVGKLA